MINLNLSVNRRCIYNQDTKLAILCNVNTVRDMFLFTLVEYNDKGYSSS